MEDSRFKALFRQFIDSCSLCPEAAGALLQRILQALQQEEP